MGVKTRGLVKGLKNSLMISVKFLKIYSKAAG